MDAISYWFGIGLVIALATIWLTKDRGHGTVVNLGLGLIGAMIGGLGFNIVMSSPGLGYSVYDMIASAAVAAIVLTSYHALMGPRPI